MRIRTDVAEMLLAGGLTHQAIARACNVGVTTVRCARIALELPAPRRGRPPQDPEAAYRAHAEPADGGHMRWTGPWTSRGVPIVRSKGRQITAYRQAFRMFHGREPEGHVTPACDLPHCVAGPHLEDRPMRARSEAVFTAIFGPAT